MGARRSTDTSRKKMMKLENKKRKWQAFLDICKANDMDRESGKLKRKGHDVTESQSSSKTNVEDVKRRKIDMSPSVETRKEQIENELQRMKTEIAQRRRDKLPKPTLDLNVVGKKAQFANEGIAGDGVGDLSSPLLLADIQHLIVTALIGPLAPTNPRWCKLRSSSRVRGVVLLIVEGISREDYRQHVECFKRIGGATSAMVLNVVSLQHFNGNLVAELLWVSIKPSTDCAVQDDKQWMKLQKVSSEKPRGLFKVKRSRVSLSTTDASAVKDVFPRTHLLLSPEQMLLQGYPLVLPGAKPMAGYVFTQKDYARVSPYSPLFGVDCEMCFTTSNEHELTRISIVNERLEVVYDTLVKPHNKIVDYLTVFSGITEDKLSDVETTLEDVQSDICRILPPDAILCGHSLNCDLHAMKMIHPYIIDTSVIYNLSGVRRRKAGLKRLTKAFLNEDIQCSANGHDSTEDSRSTLKLVQLKLSKSVDFGDVVACPNRTWQCTDVTAKQEIFCNDTGFVSSLIGQVLLHNKKVAVLSCSDLTGPQMPPELSSSNGCSTTNVFNLTSNKDVVEKTIEIATDNNLTIAHAKVQCVSDTALSQLDTHCGEICKSLAVNSLFIVVFGGSGEKNNDQGICMVQLKDSLV